MSAAPVKGMGLKVAMEGDVYVVFLFISGDVATSQVSPTYDHGLTPVELQHRMNNVQSCINRGIKPSECRKCHNNTLYMYNSFSKRGGVKYLYCCGTCFTYSSKLEVSEEDYDFLSG